MTYLEYPIILLQIYVMLYYVLKFRGLLSAPIVPVGTIIYVCTIFGFATEILSKDILSYILVNIFFFLVISCNKPSDYKLGV